MSAAEWIAKGRKFAGRSQEMRARYPRALDALEAVLALHRRAGGVAIPVFCLHCQEFNDGTWPCPTVAAIEAALRGES